MTDRHSGYIVALERNIREDDAQAIISALQHIKGVVRVEPVIANAQQAIELMRAKTIVETKLIELLQELRK